MFLNFTLFSLSNSAINYWPASVQTLRYSQAAAEDPNLHLPLRSRQLALFEGRIRKTWWHTEKSSMVIKAPARWQKDFSAQAHHDGQ